MNDNIKWLYTFLLFKDIYGLPVIAEPIKEKLYFMRLFDMTIKNKKEDNERYNFAQSLIKE